MKWAGPLKMLPKQYGSNKTLVGWKRKKRGGGGRTIVGSSPRSFDSSPSDKRSLEEPLNSVGQRQVPSVHFGEFKRFSHKGGECCSLAIAYFTRPAKGPRMSSYDSQKLAWFGGRESEEHSATGNVKPRKPGVFVNVATFFGRYLYIFVIDIPLSLYVIMRFERPCQARWWQYIRGSLSWIVINMIPWTNDGRNSPTKRKI